MHSPWRRSTLALAARIVTILVLLTTLFMPARNESRKKLHAIALMDQSAAHESNSIRRRLISEVGDTAKLTFSPPINSIDRAMEKALWEFNPRLQGAVILVSDGRSSPDTLRALHNASAAKIPVFWLPVAADQSSPEIVSIAAPARARSGQRIGVSVSFRRGSPADAELVLLMNNRSVARKAASASGTVNFLIEVPGSGPVIVGAELRDPDDGTVFAVLEQGALINITGTPSVLVISDGPSPFGRSLDEGGWSVLEFRPQNFTTELERLASTSLLVLDDVAATDLTAVAWNRIEQAVREDAMGLLVLAGANSFGLGGYRDSPLELLLPVVSEPPDDEAPTSLVFLIDVSGSMGRPGAVNDRLQMAQRATVETSRALRPIDRVGLITFDVQSRELLPVEARANHAEAIERVWPQRASGGTALIPSLERAVASLQQSGVEQRLLILLTDGFFTDADLQQIDALLRGTDIELVAMILDDGTQSAAGNLEETVVSNDGRVIRVDDVLRLPVLMRREVESHRPALIAGTAQPSLRSPAAWLSEDADWPTIDGYLLTRPREEARIHMVSQRGDVLVASMTAGAGNVVVVTSGFSGWAENWLQWSQWPDFAAALTGFLAVRDTNDIRVSIPQTNADSATLRVTLPNAKLPDNFGATLINPSGKIVSLDLQARSPGELSTTLHLDRAGQYTVVVAADDSTGRYRFLHGADRSPAHNEPPIARTWVDQGYLRLWEPAEFRVLAPAFDARRWLVGLALLLFLLTLAAERGWPGLSGSKRV